MEDDLQLSFVPLTIFSCSIRAEQSYFQVILGALCQEESEFSQFCRI